jgi:predicted esterase
LKKFTKVTGLYLLLISIFLCSVTPLSAQVVAKKVTTSTGQVVPFLQAKPTRHDVTGPNRKYPMIIFLHGGGALRSNDTSLTPTFPSPGYPPVWELNGWGPIREVGWQSNNLKATWNNKTDTFIVLQPLSPVTSVWPISYIDAMIKYGTDSLKVDTNKIYLAGHSYGGAGVFNYLNSASSNAKKLAAAVPISAWNISLNTNGANYVSAAKLPVWGFHAYDDVTTSRDTTINSINRLNTVNPQAKPLITIWPAGTVTPSPHNSAPEYVFAIHQYPYLEDGVLNIYEWFLGQNNDSLPNIFPVARAGNDTTILSSSGVANLNGSASTDADGTIVRYVWRKISGPAGGTIATPLGTSSSTTVSGLTTVGVYQFQLNVVDHRAAIARDTITITVSSTLGKSVNTNAPAGRAYTGTDVTELTSASQFTLETQIMIDSTASDWTTIIRKGYNGTHRIMFHVGPGDNSIHCIVGNGANAYGRTGANAITVGAWYHLAFVYDGTQTGNANRVKLYINGVQQTLNFDATTIPATTSSLLVGQSFLAGSNLNEGHIDHIDEVRVWSTALSGTTINDWRNKLLGSCHPNIANLVLYWPLDNNSIPTVATAELGTAYSGYVLNASYVNSSPAFASSGCGAEITQPSMLGAIKESKSPAGKLYPNPTNGLVQIELTVPVSTSVIVNVFDLYGKQLNRIKSQLVSGNNKIPVNIASLPAGTYIIEVKDGKAIMEKYKVIKR